MMNQCHYSRSSVSDSREFNLDLGLNFNLSFYFLTIKEKNVLHFLLLLFPLLLPLLLLLLLRRTDHKATGSSLAPPTG